MPTVKVLVVDDSLVARKLLGDLIGSDPELELAGTAPTAAVAFQKLAQGGIDIVLLDVEMPEMNGIEAVRKIRSSWPTLPVVMCSTLTERGASITLQALSAGASDYIAKPSAVGGGSDLRQFRADLVLKLKALTGRRSTVSPPPSVVRAAVAAMARPKRTGPIDLLAIGCSTGGPAALSEIFRELPAELGVPILVVQHMPPVFTRMLAERLTATSKVFTVEAADGDEVLPNRAYVAPGNYHVGLVRDGTKVRIALNQEAPENSCRPAVDVTFRAAAAMYGAGVLAAVLTGMGHDGARGAAELGKAGATILVQDAASCVVPSMPNAVLNAGLAEAAFPIGELGRQLVATIQRRASDRRIPCFARTAS